MSRKTPTPGTTPADNLAYLAVAGVTPDGLLLGQALAEMIFGVELPALGSVSTGIREPLVQKLLEVLWDVAGFTRGQARAELRGARKPQEITKCQAAAATELLMLKTPVEEFELVRSAIYQDDEWVEKVKSEEFRNPTSLRRRQLEAAVWIGLRDKSMRNAPYKAGVFDAFVTVINDYLDTDRRRADLKTFALSHLEQAQSDTASIDATGPSAVAALETSSRLQPKSGLREPQRRSRDPKLQHWFEDFVDKVRQQLEDEHGRDQVTDPIPMPVRWSITEQYPADQPINVWGEGDRAGPSPAAGTIETITDLFEVSSRRMVVLGRGGAGKTVLVRDLALGLLETGADTAPVIFRLSSWNPDKTTFRGWMIEQLIASHPALKTRIGNTLGQRTVAAALVDDQCILPILDGLDEVPPPLRAKVLQAINQALNRRDSLVLTSRPVEYVEAVNVGDVVTGAAVIELHDLTPDDLAAYLPRTTRPISPQTNETKWHAVLEQLCLPRAAGALVLKGSLTTPLMASLARAIYSETPADPTELLDVNRFPNTPAISNHLLDAFVRTRFSLVPRGSDSKNRRQWYPEGAQRCLGLLATSLFAQGTRDFAWWKLRAPVFTRAWIVLLALPFIVGVGSFLATADREGIRNFLLDSAASSHQPELGLVVSCVMLIVTNYGMGALSVPRAAPSRKSRKFAAPKSRDLDGVIIGFMLAMPTLFWMGISGKIISPTAMRGVYPFDHPGSLPAFASYMALIFYILTFVGFVRSQTDVTDPRLLLRHDLFAATVRSVMYGLASSLFFSVTWVTVHPLKWPVPLIVFIVGFLASMLGSASGQWYLRGTAMTVVGLPPWRFMTFLSDACDHGILRRSGGSYQFRHALLQERLAANFAQEYAGSHLLKSTIRAARADLLMAQSESGLVNDIENELRSLLDRDRFIVWPYLVKALQRSGKAREAVREAQLLCEHTKKIGRRRVARYYYDSRMLLAGLLKDQGELTQAEEVYSSLLDLTKRRKVVGFGFADLMDARTDILVHLRRQWIDGKELSGELNSRLDEVRHLRK